MELTEKLPPTNEQLVFITTYLAWVKVQAGIKNPSQEIMIQKYPLQTIYWLDTLHILQSVLVLNSMNNIQPKL